MFVTDAQVVAILARLPPNSYIVRYVRAHSVRTDAPLIFLLGGALSTIGTVAPVELTYELGNTVTAAMWVLFAGAAGGSRKTTCVMYAHDVLTDALPHLVRGKPGSKEEFLEGMLAQPQQVIVYPEFGEFLGSTGNSRNYMAGLRDVYTEQWDAKVVERNLVHRQESRTNPRLNLLGGVAPAFIETHTTQSDWENGHMSRYFMFLGERDARRSKTAPAGKDEAVHAWLVQRLREMHQTPVGRCLGMTPGALAVYSQWYGETIPALIDRVGTGWARASLERAQNVAIKAAMAASLDFGGASAGRTTWHMDELSIRFGVQIAECHIQSTLGILARLAGNMYARNRAVVLAAMPMVGTPPRTLGEVYAACTPKLSPRDIDVVMRGIKEEGLVEEHTVGLGDVRYNRRPEKVEIIRLDRAPAQETDLARYGAYADAGARARASASATDATSSISSAASTETPTVNAATMSDPSARIASSNVETLTVDDDVESLAADPDEIVVGEDESDMVGSVDGDWVFDGAGIDFSD